MYAMTHRKCKDWEKTSHFQNVFLVIYINTYVGFSVCFLVWCFFVVFCLFVCLTPGIIKTKLNNAPVFRYFNQEKKNYTVIQIWQFKLQLGMSMRVEILDSASQVSWNLEEMFFLGMSPWMKSTKELVVVPLSLSFNLFLSFEFVSFSNRIKNCVL